jgi:hypothetical protein
MVQTYTGVGANRADNRAVLSGPYAIGAAVLVGAVGGALLGVVEEFATAADVISGEYYWSVVLAGVALTLGVGWSMLALWRLGNARWLLYSIAAGVLSLACAMVGAVAAASVIELKYAFLVAGAVPALVIGLTMAYMLGGVRGRDLLVYTAVGVAWLVAGWIAATLLQNQPTPNKVPLPDSLLLWVGEVMWFLNVPLVLTAPLLAASLSSRSEAGRAAIPTRWLLIGFVLLPVATAFCFGLAVRLIPDAPVS